MNIEVRHLGLRPYAEVLELQRTLQRALIAGESTCHTILTCEHPPTITLGRSAHQENILVSSAELETRGVTTFEVERGGDVTYHGPGQVVVYPILNLMEFKRDVHWYMRLLEETAIRTLQEWDITATRYKGRTGVWLPPSDLPTARWKKISSQGVRISRWCTLHGLSLNVQNQHSGFQLLNPCGYADIESVSMEELLGSNCPTVSEVSLPLLTHLTALLEAARTEEQLR